MHRCLEIQEVVRIIVENLQHDPPHYLPALPPTSLLDWVSLARTARTCRGFSDLALDILWRDQSSLLHLLKCLPSHTWEMVNLTPAPFPIKKMRFRAPIRTLDWDRVLFYSRRVRTFKYTSGLSLEDVELLAISLPVATLFPRLRTLKWGPTQPALFPYIRMFLSPTLKSIDLRLPPDSSRLSVLSYVSSKLPSLTAVNIHRPREESTPRFTQQLTEEATTLVLALKHVQEITIPAVLPAAYERLASLSRLKHLTVGNLEGCLPPNAATSDSPSFRSLARLTVVGSTIQLGKNLLRWCDQTPLEHFCFYCTLPATGAEVSDLFTTLGNGFLHRHRLTSIDIQLSFNDDLGTNATAYEMSSIVLRPLLVFTNLSYLDLLTPLNVSFDDDFVDAMSIAWPKIKVLRFRNFTADSRRGSITLSALRAFALRCPRLEELELEFDATTVPQGPHPVPHTPRVRQTRLVLLAVGDSPIEAPALVAHYLSAMFPGLQSIEANRAHGLTDDEEEEMRQAGRSTYHNWMEVKKFVPLLAAARSEEETSWTA
ncbi:hypothetical protein C8F04DRAFT_1114825 [Mycena alexandri]|uniref:F-box domain-containing protein n=1 Tax=Mycena alexandri TaxID=1745969 RepID=A0AAD6SQT4_9AGAR|nr:hypothetical protein C8F04DRAFT_1114825 [Mycena alexandri]